MEPKEEGSGSLYFTQKQGSLTWCPTFLGMVVNHEKQLNNHLKAPPGDACSVCVLIAYFGWNGKAWRRWPATFTHWRMDLHTQDISLRNVSVRTKSIKASVLHSET